MADEATAVATSVSPRGGQRVVAGLLIATALGGMTYHLARTTILGRYVRYRAEDAALAVRREARNTSDAFDDWWRHVQRTVATRDRRRAADPVDDLDTPRWVGMVDVPPP